MLLLLHLLQEQYGKPPGEGSLYAERLNWALSVSELTQSKLARLLGVSPQSIQHLADPKKHARGSRHTVAIAEATGVQAQWLASGKGDAVASQPPQSTDGESSPSQPASNVKPVDLDTRRIPLLNYVQAGTMVEVCDNDFARDYDEYLQTDRDDLSGHTFALEIRGNSMMAPPGSGDESFNEGDRILVDCDVTPLPGDFVVAKNGPDGEHGEHAATFKKYRPRGVDEQGRDVFELVPLNPDYPVMRSDRQAITIIGVMMEHRRYRNRR